MISYISEHSAEYALVPNLAAILSKKYSAVVPIYFWATREGGSLAEACVGPHRVRLVAAYARRPKVESPGSKLLRMKINAPLFRSAELGRNLGVPVLAGVPLATELLRFCVTTPCAWFLLNDRFNMGADVIVTLDRSGQIQDGQEERRLVRGPLSEAEILGEIAGKAVLMEWGDAVQAIRALRKSEKDYGWFVSGYRPFFLIIPD